LTKTKSDTGSHGSITVYKRGYGWLPELLRKELGILNATGTSKIPYILDANCVILLHKNATQNDILSGLSALIYHLSAKWKVPKNELQQILSWLPEIEEQDKTQITIEKGL